MTSGLGCWGTGEGLGPVRVEGVAGGLGLGLGCRGPRKPKSKHLLNLSEPGPENTVVSKMLTVQLGRQSVNTYSHKCIIVITNLEKSCERKYKRLCESPGAGVINFLWLLGQL